METAGRAVVFSGITVAIGLLALIALPLPFLRSMGYGGMLIPLVSVLVAITLLPVVLAKAGSRLDWPHRRTDDKASRAWTRWATVVARRRWVAARAGMAIVLALVVAATDLQLGTSDADTVAKSGDAKDGPGGAREVGHRRGRAAAARDPRRSAARTRVRWQRRRGRGRDPRRGRARQPAVAPRRHRAGRGGPGPRQRHQPRAATRSTASATPRMPWAGRAGRRPAGGERRLHRRGLRQLPAHDRADHDHHVHPAGAGVPLAAPAGEGDRAQRAERRRRVGRAGARLAARLRLGGDLGHPGHGLDPVVDAADDLRVPVRAVDGLRGVHPRPHARGVRPHGLDRAGGDHRHRAHGPARDERGADPVPDVRRDGLGPGHGPEDVRHGPRRRHPARRDGDPRADRARGDRADGPLELVAATWPARDAPRGAVARRRRGRRAS